MFRRSLTLAGAALVAFHVWLFAGQVWSGALADPGLIFRWLVAGGLIGGLILLKRQGESLVRSRKAVALWVLAALLHGPAVAHRLEAPGAPAVPEVIVTLTQTIAGVAGLIGFAFLLAGLTARRRFAYVALGLLAVRVFVPALSPSVGRAFSPRPPPLD